jgi:hypothetical protein
MNIPYNNSALPLQKVNSTYTSPHSYINTSINSNNNNILTSISNSIKNTKNEILQLKSKNNQFVYNSYLDSSQIKNRKIDPDIILSSINNVSTSLSSVKKEINNNAKRHYSYEGLSNDVVQEGNVKCKDNELTLKKLLKEIVKKNSKIKELQNEVCKCKEELTSIQSAKELKSKEVIHNFKELKELYLIKDAEKDKTINDLENKNDVLRKENECLINKLILEKGNIKRKEMKYKKTINDLLSIISKLKNEYYGYKTTDN